MHNYWQKQDPQKPLFPDLIWNKPEQKSLAGNLLIIGGSLQNINNPSTAYSQAINSGVGTAKIVMPNSTKKLLGPLTLPEIEFVDSNVSGSFAHTAYEPLVAYCQWADAVLLAGNFGRSSETAILLEKISNLKGIQTYADDGVDNLLNQPEYLLNRPETLLVVSFAQLQKIAQNTKFPNAFTSNMGLVKLAETIHSFTAKYSAAIIIEYKGNLVTARDGHVITTPINSLPNNWQVTIAATATVWWLQNPKKPLEALATAILQL